LKLRGSLSTLNADPKGGRTAQTYFDLKKTIGRIQMNNISENGVSYNRRKVRTRIGATGLSIRAVLQVIGPIGVLAIVPNSAHAFNLYNGNSSGNNLQINLSTTLSYTPIFRVQSPSAVLTSPTTNANGSEGDLDFAHGLVSNEIDVLPVLDIKDGDYGAHFSGEAYLNSSFLGTNQNDQPSTLNPYSIGKGTDFTSAVRNVEGENARVLDAFVYANQHFGTDDSQTITVKVGRQTLLWGQSLFLSNNGIAAGNAPFDIITANNNPNAQTQAIIEPTGQVVMTYQPNQTFTFQGYYQFEWQHDFFQGVGAYFSSADILDKGGERLIAAPGAYLFRGEDISPSDNNGQFGASVQAAFGNYDIGLYALRYDSKAPTVYLEPGVPTSTANGLSVGAYNVVYPRDIWIEGTSLSTTVGPVNVAGEISFRQHMNLATGANVATASSNVNSNPAYPVGQTWAGQTSAIYISPGIPFDPGGVSMLGEIGFNHVLSVTENKDAVTSSPHRNATAAQFQFVITPTYYNVVPNLQLGFPIGLAYDFLGRSQVDASENHGTGSVNFGVTATYKVTWIASVTYNDYIGAANPELVGEPSVADRSYVLLNLQHSF
jgi:hypothetical protein